MLYTRNIIPFIIKELSSPEILILLGSRQVGKTSILQLMEKYFLTNGIHYLSLDLDIETNLEILSTYENTLDFIKTKGLDPVTDTFVLLLDEFQRVNRAGKTLKNLHDHHKNIKIISTGSSSIEINKTISESMSGRKMIFRVFPLSFREYLIFKELDNLLDIYDSYIPGQNISSFIFNTFEKHCMEKIIFGSYPAVVLENDRERKGKKIFDILNSYLRKDIREHCGVSDTVRYKNVLEFLGITAGNLMNINKIANQLGTYYRKINDIVNIAIETYIIEIIRPYFKNRKNEIVRNPKIYFEDTGLRNFLIKNMNNVPALRNDWGILVENFFYNEIVNNIDIFTEIKFFRTKSGTEIDFLLIKNRTILPVEVKSGTCGFIPLSLLNFCIKEKIKKGVIMNKDYSGITEKEGITFVFIPYVFSSHVSNLLGGE